MNERLTKFIQYKTSGHQAEFANIMGWSPQYLMKLIKGEGFGIRPVISLIERFPELNARWLLTGEGSMLVTSAVEMSIKKRLMRLLELEKYIPFMSAEELRQVTEGDSLDFSQESIEVWQQMFVEKDIERKARYAAAMEKQKELATKKSKRDANPG